MPNLTYMSHDDLIASWSTPLQVGLLTAAPNPDGTGVLEPNMSDGYARQDFDFAVSRGTMPGYEGSTVLTNTSNMVFGPATNLWTTFSYFGLFDADGNLRAYGQTRSKRSVETGNAEVFEAGNINIYLR